MTIMDGGSVASMCERARANLDARLWFRADAAADAASGMRFGALIRQARRLGGALQQRGLGAGNRVAVLLGTPEHGLPLLLGMLQASIVPILVQQPASAQGLSRAAVALAATLESCGASALIASRTTLSRLSAAAPDLPQRLGLLALEDLVSANAELAAPGPADPQCLLMQVESAANGELEVRTWSRAELFERLAEAARQLAVQKQDVFVSFLPQSSEVGLLSWLLPLYTLRSAVLLPFAQFVKQPSSWLQALTRARGTISFAPSDAFAFCAERLDAAERSQLELSRWRVAGWAERPLTAAARTAFTRALAGTGFSAASLDARGTAALLASPDAASSGQQALWYLAQLAPDSVAYNVPICLRITSAFDPRALQRALEHVIRRHPPLRTVFSERGGVPYRSVLDEPSGWFEVEDASHSSGAELERRLLETTEQRFDLAAGPLFTARLFVRAPDDAVLLMVAHHIVLDALSVLLLLGELLRVYPQLAAGGTLAPAAVDTAYDDFVRAQRALLRGPSGARLRSYWAAQLVDAPPSLDLPSDRARPPVQSHRGSVRPLRLSEPLCAALRELAERERTTLFAVALAGFFALLHRSTRQRDLVVATQVSGRSSHELQAAVGYFVNTVPLRARVAGSTTFLQLVRQLRSTVVDALDHGELPFASIVEQAKLPRDPSRAPLSQLMFQLQAHKSLDELGGALADLSSGRAADVGGLALEHHPLPQRSAQCDLRIDLRDFGGEVAGILEYNTDLFDAERIAQLSNAFIEILQELADDPSATIRGAADAARLSAWNRTGVDYPDGRVHRAFEQRAAEQPDAIALQLGSETLDYAELNRRANRVARHLRQRGVQRDVLVGVAMERSIDLVVALLAIVKAGGAYVPFDPGYPAARLDYMRQDAAPLLVIVDTLDGGRDAQWSRAALRETSLDVCVPAHDLEHETRGGDLVYMIYTSGSTGAPKGVGNTHAGLWNRLCWMQSEYRLAPHDCVLQKTPYSFDVSVWEFFWPLLAGARLAIARPEGHKDTRYLLEEIARQHVTTLHFVPSMLDAFLREPDLTQASSLRRVICSGEALPYSSMLRCLERMPHVELHNLYGPTEASIDVTAWRCQAHPRGIVPIGRPIANTQIHLLDEQRRPVAIGEVGELYIAGVGLARGYHNRPELTAERFVPNPFVPDPSARMYKTGDLARYDDDGTIEYLGRNDEQIKLRGFRVELGEIEAVAAQHPHVQQCVVVTRKLGHGARLEAFVVSDSAELDPRLLETWLAARLPEYMVPRQIARIEAVPLTPNGKADRKGLLERSPASTGPERKYVAPRSETERVLASVWQRVLGVDQVSIHDNYFELRGDSIRSLQVRALAREQGVEVEVQALLAHQTIAELAQSLAAPAQLGREARLAPFALIASSERALLVPHYEDAFPVTQLQLGMLYHSQLTPDSWAYLDSLAFEFGLARDFSEDALRGALEAVVQRHPMLRASFEMAAYERPLTLISRSVSLPLHVHDLRGHDAAKTQETLRAFTLHNRKTGYALSAPPLFRVAAHVLEDRRVRFTLSFHHAILDGWSAATLTRELLSEYLRNTGDALPTAPAPELGFAEFVALEQAAVRDAASRDHFARELEGCELVSLPRWPGAPLATQSGSARLILPIDAELTSRLVALAARLRAPLKTLLLAAHVRALAAFSGSDEVVTGCVTHGRPELSGAESVLGLFLNTLPLRVALGSASWSELIARLAEHERVEHPHRRYPLQEILRQTGHHALFTTAFNFVSFHLYSQLLSGSGLSLIDFEVHENTSFALLANFVRSPVDDGLSLHLEYDAQRVTLEQAQQIARGHLLSLCALADDAAAPARASCVIDADEQARIRAYQGSAAPLRVCAVTELFEASLARVPDHVAVSAGEEKLTYAELDGRASALEAQLAAAGVAAGEVVGICAEPSLARAIAVLATLRAGCAYLPLDPAFPADRLAYMLQHTGVRTTLVSPAHVDAAFLEGARRLVITGEPSTVPVPTRSRRVAPDDAAYVIYTSGSTGRPKGTVMPHAPLANLVSWQCARSSLPDGAVTAQCSAFSFDVSFQEMFATWASGGQLSMVPEGARKDTRALCKLLREARVARLFIPVVVLHQLADVAEQLGLTFPELREIVTAGEQLEISRSVRAFFRGHPDCRLDNQYGPTETHVATAFALPENPASWPATPSIGQPLPGTRAYVLDTAGRIAPLGVPGELYLAGACVARGYVADPELTAQRFLPDPFVRERERESQPRMYMTGDRARWLPDGTLEYLGRRDGQVKIRGHRVELAEVELALMQLGAAALQRAAVIAVEHELVAYLVCAWGQSIDLDALELALSRKLPAYMVPSRFSVLDALPLTPSGKLDRRALPSPAQQARAVRSKRVPENALETELCGLWQEVLGRSDLGTDEDFFECGGDSLRAVRLMARVQRHFALELPLSTLIESPTVVEMAESLRRAGLRAESPLAIALNRPQRRASAQPPLFCVHPIGGNVLCYVPLARRLDRPCYGLQARGLDGRSQPHTTLIEMASAYAGEILTLQPSGAVHLAGWSFGGLVAVEVARQLRQAGREVAPVYVLDGMAKLHASGEPSDEDLIACMAMELLGGQLDDRLWALLDAQRGTIDPARGFQQLLAAARAAGIPTEAAESAQLEPVLRVMQSNIRAACDYLPPQNDADVVLLRCTAPLPAQLKKMHELFGSTHSDPQNGWAPFCRELRVIPVAGDHLSLIFEPHVAEIAELLRASATKQPATVRSADRPA